MSAQTKLILQLQFKLNGLLQSLPRNEGEIRAVQEEIAYIMRWKGSPRKGELERIRARFGLDGSAHANPWPIEPVNHAALPVSPPSVNKERWLYVRFCIECDGELVPQGQRFVCKNSDCRLNVI